MDPLKANGCKDIGRFVTGIQEFFLHFSVVEQEETVSASQMQY